MSDVVGAEWVEPRGIEPLTSALPARRSPSGATAPENSSEYMQPPWGCQRGRLLLPVLLRGAAPEGFEAVVVAGFFGEDMHHDVEEVEADPGRPLVEALGAWTVSLFDHALYDLLGYAARLALGLGAGYHEIVRVGDESPQIYQGHVCCEHLAGGASGCGGHLVGERLAFGRELLLPGDGLVSPHRISSFNRPPPSVRLPSPL